MTEKLTKPTLPRDVAEAIEKYLKEYGKQTLLYTFCNPKHIGWSHQYDAFNKISLNDLMSALVNGYTIAQSPEEKLREYYFELKSKLNKYVFGSDTYMSYRNEMIGIEKALSILGIQIEGINAGGDS